MSDFVKRIQDGTIPVKIEERRVRGYYHQYGRIPSYDKLVDSAKASDRIKAARLGYGLEKLMDDNSPEVQQAVLEYVTQIPA